MNGSADRQSADSTQQAIGPLGLGALIGAVAGIAEVVVRMSSGSSAVTRHYLLEAAVLYTGAGVLFGLVLWLIAIVLRKGSTPNEAHTASLLAFFCFLMVGGYVNLYHLPQATNRGSLIVTGLILVGSVGVGFALHGILRAMHAAGLGGRLGVLGRRRFLWPAVIFGVMALWLLSFLPPGKGSSTKAGSGTGRRRNVVLIVVDALRPDHMSLYGYSRETTPRIDSWAREGVVFENAMVHAPWTKPSTATLLTSLYPSTHGVNPMASALPDAVDSLPEILRRNGFRTAIFSANHFITPSFGFGRGVEFFYSSRPPRLAQLMLGHILEQLGSRIRVIGALVDLLEQTEKALVGGGAPEGGLDAEGLTRAFWSWLDEVETAGEPFFAYMHYMEPHAPYSPPPHFDQSFMPKRLAGAAQVTDFPDFEGFLPFDPGPEVSADSLENMIALYDGEILCADHWIGRLFHDLKLRDLRENTLVLLTADHGEEFYDHRGWGHGHSLFQELLHVPLIMSGAGLAPGAGRRFPHIVRHVDLLPTILEVCGLSAPEGIAGRSLLPILRGEEPLEPARVVFSEVNHGGHFARSIQEGTRKVIRCQRGGAKRMLAFDLAADPCEEKNLIGPGSTWPGRMLSRLEEFHEVASQAAEEEVEIVIDEATRERLRAIGYMK